MNESDRPPDGDEQQELENLRIFYWHITEGGVDSDYIVAMQRANEFEWLAHFEAARDSLWDHYHKHPEIMQAVERDEDQD